MTGKVLKAQDANEAVAAIAYLHNATEHGVRALRVRHPTVLIRMFTGENKGDLIAFLSAGAYGAVMASEYNTRPLVPEVLVNGDHFAVIRARPSFDEILNRDTIPPWL